MSCDHELANEIWVRCSGKNVSYITILLLFNINLLVFFQECRSLIGYGTLCLFCDRWVVHECALIKKITDARWCFRNVYEKDLDNLLND